MTSDSSWGGLWKISWPLVVSMFMQFSVGVTDVYVAGGFSPEAQAAVGFTSQLLWFFSIIANSLSVGVVALVARSDGAEDISSVRNVARQGFIAAWVFCLPLTLGGVLYVPAPEVLTFLPGPVADEAVGMMPWYAAAVFPQALLVVGSAVLRSRVRVLTLRERNR